MRYSLNVLIFLLLFNVGDLHSQSVNSIALKADTLAVSHDSLYLDSATIARNLFVKDSILHVQDSLVMQFIKAPEVTRPNLFIEFLLKKYIITDRYLLHSISDKRAVIFKYGLGSAKNSSKLWILWVVLCLIITFSILRYYFTSEIDLIFSAFYGTRSFNKITGEAHIFSSWQFLILYIMFGFAAGIYLYLLTRGLGNIYGYNDIQLFFVLSMMTVWSIALKIILLKLLGFVFNLQYHVRGYLNILYVTLFNILFILLPMLLIVALVPHTIPMLVISVAVLALMYLSTFIRAYVTLLSKHSFSKTYLFLYICAFELCPFIVLIKALNIV